MAFSINFRLYNIYNSFSMNNLCGPLTNHSDQYDQKIEIHEYLVLLQGKIS